MWVEPVHLEGRVIALDPLSLDHAPALWRVADLDIFAYMTLWPADTSLDAFQAYVQQVLKRPSACPFAIVLQETGQPVGITSYLDIRPEHRGLEIGNTWIARPYQGSRVNPESKYLLLRHAFETLGAIRVQLKTDLRNVHSQRAIEKLGAHKEGILRKHMILPNGYVRDSVMYSITDDEWPGVKAGLEARLGYVL